MCIGCGEKTLHSHIPWAKNDFWAQAGSTMWGKRKPLCPVVMVEEPCPHVLKI